ncbi:MAG: ADP-ribosylglycohydrolase family protein [Synergistaceae bacterium]|nr:ADP-ribosylglycohydrolase family protein [Synergistaceae bacterium]
MLGAVVGDIIGSVYHEGGMKETDFPLFADVSVPTDDTVLTLAVTEALMMSMLRRGDKTTGANFAEKVKSSLRTLCRHYRHVRYGKSFYAWLTAKYPHPFSSHGNNPAVRVSPVSWAFDDLDSVEWFAEISAVVTHDHPDGLRGAQCTAGAVFLSRTGHSKDDIRGYITGRWGYDLSRSLDEIRPGYVYSSSCQDSLPEAFTAFLEGNNFEDVIRKAVSLGGESDSLAAISGAIAEPMFGIPTLIQVEAFNRLQPHMKYIVQKWEQWRDLPEC